MQLTDWIKLVFQIKRMRTGSRSECGLFQAMHMETLGCYTLGWY